MPSTKFAGPVRHSYSDSAREVECDMTITSSHLSQGSHEYDHEHKRVGIRQRNGKFLQSSTKVMRARVYSIWSGAKLSAAFALEQSIKVCVPVLLLCHPVLWKLDGH